MAQNITWLGASYTDVPAIGLPLTGGGEALFSDVSADTATVGDVKSGKTFHLANGSLGTGTLAWNFKGDEPEFIEQFYDSGSIALSSTNYPSWTPSTTAKAIKTSSSVKTFTADMVNYEYLIRWRCQFDAVYPDGTTMVAAPVREVCDLWQTIFRRPNSLANIQAGNFNANACVTLLATPLTEYYNASGTHTYTFAITYGVYPSATAATFSNATTNTPTVTVKTPAYNARCSTTYFDKDTTALAIDQDKSKFRFIGELYRMKPGAVLKSLYGGVVDLFNNPIGSEV